MYFTIGTNEQLNDLLNRIGEKLQLNQSRREKIEGNYQSVCNWIHDDNKYFSNYELEFYPQGSYKIGTTVKPLKGDEFDLDFVLQINGKWVTENPMQVLKYLQRRLKENGKYNSMVEMKNRCVRLNYENEFHMDILPGFPEQIKGYEDKLKVPDRELKDWTYSNPKGYADWFIQRCMYKQVFEEKASIEPLPEGVPYSRIEPLKRAVQLMKRYRDIYYQDKGVEAPKSIILTTLAGIYYRGEDSEYIAIKSILIQIHKAILDNKNAILEIFNPKNHKEKLSEKWDEEPYLYDEFKSFIKNFKDDWDKVISAISFQEKAKILQKLFGETVSKEVIAEQAEYINKCRANNSLGINRMTGTLGIFDTSKQLMKEVHKNTFYGE